MNKQEFDGLYSPRYGDFFRMVHHIGDSLNSRKDRFDKADLLEAAVERMTNGLLEWIDAMGYDHRCIVTGKLWECKSQKALFFTPTGKPRERTKKIKLTNTLQRSDSKALNKTADFLLLVDTHHLMMGVVPYPLVVSEYAREVSDGFECEIPIEEIKFLHGTPNGGPTPGSSPAVSYKEAKMQLQRDYVEGFFT